MSEVIVTCPRCGDKLRVTLTPIQEPLPDHRVGKAEKPIQAEVTSEQKPELDVEAVDWKPWKEGTGEWVNMLEAMELFTKIQKADGQLEYGDYRYWIFGKNRDMIARKKKGD